MIIRSMTAGDASDVAALSGQLGYPTTAAQVRERLEAISQTPDNVSFVAERNGVVVGWVNVFGVHLLASPASFAEIGGLVVDTNERRQGIGRQLMAHAEAWAAAQNYGHLRLRSGLHRTDAHHFYESIGYTLARTSLMFRKELSKTSCP